MSGVEVCAGRSVEPVGHPHHDTKPHTVSRGALAAVCKVTKDRLPVGKHKRDMVPPDELEDLSRFERDLPGSAGVGHDIIDWWRIETEP